MVILDMNDVGKEMGKLWALLDAIRHEIEVAEVSLDPEDSPVDLAKSLALLSVFEDRFDEVYRHVVEASAEPVGGRKHLGHIPF
jgi:hypothetical protein